MNRLTELQYPFDGTPVVGEAFPVADGVRWVRMPLPFALDHINTWLLDDGNALAVVDTGLGHEQVRSHWNAVLAQDPRPVERVVVTHHHPDHIGQALWLAARDGAPVLMTQGEYLASHALWNQLPGLCVPDMVELFRVHGLDAGRLATFVDRGNSYRKGVPELPGRFHRLFDGDVIRIGGNDWRVIVGFGHSPEHASLYCQALGLLISGDMLLPRISTNISVFAAMPESDPLRWFLDSLSRIKDLPDETLVLPSHGRPFRGIRARVEQLEAHHRDRCDELLDAIDAPRSAAELLTTLFPRELDTHQLMFAMGEAIAHLNYLAGHNKLRRTADRSGLIRFERTE